MHSKEELVIWKQGVDYFKGKNHQLALETFSLLADYSRISFNISVILSQMGRHSEAVGMLSHAIEKDRYFGASYFQRGYAHFLNGFYDLSKNDYDICMGLLRDNEYIDYTPLGMKFHLYRSEVLFNRAMCKEMLDDNAGALDDIAEAQKYCRDGLQSAIIQNAARSGIKETDEITIFSVPADIIFEPKDSKIKNIKRKTHLKNAAVVHAKNGDKTYSGFTGSVLMEELTLGSITEESDRENSRKDDTLTQLRKQQNFHDLAIQDKHSTARCSVDNNNNMRVSSSSLDLNANQIGFDQQSFSSSSSGSRKGSMASVLSSISSNASSASSLYSRDSMESVEGAASFEDFLSQRVNSMDMSTEVGLHVQLDDDQLCTSMRDSTDRRISEFGTLNNGNNTNNRESSMTFGKSKIKFQYSGDDATLANKKVILLVSPADLILSEIIEKIAAKLKINIAAAAARAVDGDQDQDEKDRAGSEAKKITLSYKDSDEDEEFIAILDDEDLTLAAEEGIIYVEVH